MVTVTLDDRDTAILERLDRAEASVDSLAESASCDPDYLRDRLPELADNGLVERVEDDVYRLTASGHRAITGSPAGRMDDRIDTSEDVESAIEAFGLRPDREEAVRNAYAFLHYWGDATASEIVDGVYSENPAGSESTEAWWTDGVRDRLAGLPGIEPADSLGEPWRYAGTPTAAEVTEDGRLAPDDDLADETSVRYALARADLDEGERAAVRAAFAVLVRAGEAGADAIADEAYADEGAGYDAAEEWWDDCVRPALEAFPGVERVDDAAERWRYRQVDEGSMATDPGAESPEGPLGPEETGDE